VDPEDFERELIELALAQPVSAVTRAAWGFTNRTDMVTLEDGERVVVQRYRRRQDAEYRLAMMRGLQASAARVGIPVPQVRQFSLEGDPAWVIYDVLPGVPVAEAGEFRPGGSRFPQIARIMGELLADFRELPTPGLEVDQLWADPERLAKSAAGWARLLSVTNADRYISAVRRLFADRPAVLAHGDFSPINVLTDGAMVTGLLDFEAVRLADPLFDAAWWAWAVSVASPEALTQAWPAFLEGAGIDAAEPGLAHRIRVLQVLRMLEQLAAGNLTPGIARIVRDRLHAALA